MSKLKRSKIKAIIFDCDGTLVDSEPAHLLSWQRVLQIYGYHLSPQEHASYAGVADSLLAEIFAKRLIEVSDKSLGLVLNKEKIELLLFQKNAHYRSCVEQKADPIEPTVEFVRKLAKEKNRLNLKLAVASAALKQNVLIHLTHLGLIDFFEVILSGYEDLADYNDPEGVNKPKPYIYLQAAKLLNISTNECVAIEDSFTGVSSAVEAGCFTVAIPNSYTMQHDLSQANLTLESLLNFTPDEFLKKIESLDNIC